MLETYQGALPMLCTPTICNMAVTKTLIDGGAGLNVLSVEAFGLLHVPHGRLRATKPFSGVVDGSTCPLGQICLPVTFVTSDNYRTELIDFDIACIGLPYNAILGYPALAKFMAATHPTYNLMKMPRSCHIHPHYGGGHKGSVVGPQARLQGRGGRADK